MWRVLAFLALFIITSGIIGPKIIGAGYVNKEGFVVYGGAGKALLFGALVFLLLMYRRKKPFSLPGWKRTHACWLIAWCISLLVAWHSVGRVINGNASNLWVVATHTAIITTVVLALLASFGTSALVVLWRTYRRELRASLFLGVGFVGFLYAVYGLWRVLATAVMHAVAGLLKLSGLQVFIIPPQTLLLDKFGIAISQYCSGIDSIALFTALYVLIGILDWSKLNKAKFCAAFIPALILLFGVNILRVYGLIMAGYYISPQIAFSLFHTYAGMVFFIIYSAIFWKLCYKWMLKSPPAVPNQSQ